jgi:hypothetical protein
MRAYYTSNDGRTADLCQYIYSNTTRVVIRKHGIIVSRTEYKTWGDAINALIASGKWTNDLTGSVAQLIPF